VFASRSGSSQSDSLARHWITDALFDTDWAVING
jgi:hypothetical protein